jgi:hypothetical protein
VSRRLFASRAFLLAFGLVFAPAARAAAQLVALRSVPVASGDQFLVYPTRRMGMGGPSIALRDSWLDPFVNPAKGALTTESAFFASPTFYGISEHNGAGRTLPLSGLFTGGAWFGGVSMALQQIENRQGTPVAFPVTWEWTGAARRLDESASRNLYLHGFAGRRVAEGMSVGAGVSYASLDALDGVDLLYQGSDGVEQDGDVVDFRAGLYGGDEGGDTFELLLLHRRLEMRHDVRWIEWRWLPDQLRGEIFVREQEEWDETRTWGVHAGYDTPLSDAGWRLGGIFTLNRKDHPKIPNYQIQNIPRDPGDTWGFDMGVGLSRASGPLELGVDVVFEPIWSDTWNVLDRAVVLPSGRLLDPGDKEIENEFFFSNVHLRMGIGREVERWGFSLGLQATSYAYELDQFNNVTSTRRTQDESWMEWTPSWSGSLRFPEVEVRYTARVTTGTGRPGVDFSGPRAEALAGAADFIVAPAGPLTLQDVRVLTHQIAVRLPLR